MHYAQMRKFDVANGTGIRTSLFVSGCTRGCKGCFNTQYRSFDYGTAWSETVEEAFMQQLADANVHGVTILGGEPMDQIQDNDLVNLLKRIKAETTHTIWLYSGYTFEMIMDHPKRAEILSYCDVLVDGPFIEELKDLKLKFRGSQNQRIIDVKASLENQCVILHELG